MKIIELSPSGKKPGTALVLREEPDVVENFFKTVAGNVCKVVIDFGTNESIFSYKIPEKNPDGASKISFTVNGTTDTVTRILSDNNISKESVELESKGEDPEKNFVDVLAKIKKGEKIPNGVKSILGRNQFYTTQEALEKYYKELFPIFDAAKKSLTASILAFSTSSDEDLEKLSDNLKKDIDRMIELQTYTMSVERIINLQRLELNLDQNYLSSSLNEFLLEKIIEAYAYLFEKKEIKLEDIIRGLNKFNAKDGESDILNKILNSLEEKAKSLNEKQRKEVKRIDEFLGKEKTEENVEALNKAYECFKELQKESLELLTQRNLLAGKITELVSVGEVPAQKLEDFYIGLEEEITSFNQEFKLQKALQTIEEGMNNLNLDGLINLFSTSSVNKEKITEIFLKKLEIEKNLDSALKLKIQQLESWGFSKENKPQEFMEALVNFKSLERERKEITALFESIKVSLEKNKGVATNEYEALIQAAINLEKARNKVGDQPLAEVKVDTLQVMEQANQLAEKEIKSLSDFASLYQRECEKQCCNTILPLTSCIKEAKKIITEGSMIYNFEIYKEIIKTAKDFLSDKYKKEMNLSRDFPEVKPKQQGARETFPATDLRKLAQESFDIAQTKKTSQFQ